MSHLSDFESAVNNQFERLQKAHDGLAADVAFLVAEAHKIPTHELDDADIATVERVKEKLASLADKFDALDALTTPPPAPSPEPSPTDEDHG